MMTVVGHIFIVIFLLNISVTTWSCPRTDDPVVTEAPDDGISVTRSMWGARSPISTTSLTPPVPYVFIHHTAGARCMTQSVCNSVVRGIQNYHMDTKGWDDIGYSFLIGEDGRVYEGRGWDTVGAHTSGHNDIGIGIAFIGTFTEKTPNDAAINVAKHLITRGVALGKVSSTYKLRGHRDVSSTTCPGNSLHREIKTWDHY